MSYSVNTGSLGAKARSRAFDISTRYGCLLCFVLFGYATFGKGFAYLGVPPLFIGEITLILGLLVLLRSGCGIAMLASVPSVLLLLLLTFVLLRTLPYISSYGMVALRDSVVVVYGLFAFIVIAVLLERPERLWWALALYSRFAWFYGFVAMVVMNLEFIMGSMMPVWPMGGLPLVFVRLGEGSCHLAGAAAFAILGLRRVGPTWAFVTLIAIGSTAVSRGAMLASLVPLALVAILGREKRRLGLILAVAAGLFTIAYVADLKVEREGGRSIGPQQIVSGFESIIGTSKEANFDGTKQWRLAWWQSIVNYTVNGSYFWTGKGFGVNLAEDDGYVVGRELDGPPVRSPHNVNMTILARSGVPGLVLWLATVAAWLGMLLRMVFVARRRGDSTWSDIFLWVASYGLAIVIDACFDVALEGPMLGIWFWCLFGLGIAVTMIYRAKVDADRVEQQRGRPSMALPGRQAEVGTNRG